MGLATYARLPGLAPDERPVLSSLADHGLGGEPVAWDDDGVEWSRYRAVVVRSTWDYHRKIASFRRWIARLEESGVPLLNPGAALRWNLDKRYLLELERRGVGIVPTEWIPAGATRSLTAIAAERRWSRVVVKPVVSASAHGAWRVDLPCGDLDSDRFREEAAERDLLVQPFLEEVCRDGEWSLVYFDGRFSHAVIKRPAAGDYRVQYEFGGRWAAAHPDRSIVAAADAALAATPFDPSDLLYARVDGVVDQGGFRLMELELVEPALFLDSVPDGCRRFAAAIARRVHALDP